MYQNWRDNQDNIDLIIWEGDDVGKKKIGQFKVKIKKAPKDTIKVTVTVHADESGDLHCKVVDEEGKETTEKIVRDKK